MEPDWAALHRELKRKHVTLSILWDEYIEQIPQGYRYSRFCELYRSWEGRVSVTMRQAHIGGDKLFVDYAGDTVPVIVDRLTGEVRQAQIFVAVMGASNFTYAEASWTQALGDWIGAHMPSSHRRYADWTVGRIRRDAALVGPATAALCDLILEHRPHPEQGFRSCLGILRLARPFGAGRLEAAAAHAIEIGALTYGSVRSILDHKLDRHAAHQRPADGASILHPNIRGSRYYQ